MGKETAWDETFIKKKSSATSKSAARRRLQMRLRGSRKCFRGNICTG